MKKRILALTLAAIMIISMNESVVFAANAGMSGETTEETEAVSNAEAMSSGGYVEPTAIEIPAEEISDDQIWNADEALEACGSSESEYWDNYTADEFWTNFLNTYNAEQQEVWNKLEAACEIYLLSDQEAEEVNHLNMSGGRTAFVDVSGLNVEVSEISDMIDAFTYSHPQYYYISNSFYYNAVPSGDSNVLTRLALGIYEDYVGADAREVATQKIKAQLDEWIADAEATGTTDAEKELAVYNTICNEVSYDYLAAANGQATLLNRRQSVDSAFLEKEAVCAGYTKALTMLLNGMGIEAMGVTSSNHAWNEIKINGNWYATDSTWGDSEGYIRYRWYNRSYAAIAVEDGNQQAVHVKDAAWDKWITTECIDDTSFDRSKNTFTIPNIEIENQMITITLQGDIGQTIYYTTDGSTPTQNSLVYTAAFSTEQVSTLKVVVDSSDSRFNPSRIVTVKIQNRYLFSPNADAVKGIMDPVYVEPGTTINLPANKFVRMGYGFTGWNTAANGSGTSYADEASISEMQNERGTSLTLYAQWRDLTDDEEKEQEEEQKRLEEEQKALEEEQKRLEEEQKALEEEQKRLEEEQKAQEEQQAAQEQAEEEIKYTLQFHKNGATSGTMSALKNRAIGTMYKLPANKFKRKGYTFTGWNTKANGKGITYKNNASLSYSTTKNNQTVTLYAQWKKTKYKITYKLKGGKNHRSNKKTYYVTTSTIKLKNPTRKGYTFKGWYTTSKYKKKVTRIKKGSTGNVVLYARWKKR